MSQHLTGFSPIIVLMSSAGHRCNQEQLKLACLTKKPVCTSKYEGLLEVERERSGKNICYPAILRRVKKLFPPMVTK